jgi:RNA polymerase sigma-B factor
MSSGDESRSLERQRQLVELDRAVQRCRSTVDEAIARRTIPSKRREWSYFRGQTFESSVEDDVWRDHVALTRRRDEQARDRLVLHYEGHARSLAKRFYRQREPLEDLQQVALEALLLALQRFDPEHKKPFFGFANPTIIGSLRRHYRDVGWSVRVPRRVHDLASTMRDATELLNQDLGRPPTAKELADLMGIAESEVDQAQAAINARSTDSIDAPIGDQESADIFGAEDKNLGLAENWMAVQQVLAVLPETDRDLLQLYFFDELTQTEIAERTGVSQMHVSRSLSRILRQIRSHLPGE